MEDCAWGLCNSLNYLIKPSFYQEELNDYARGCMIT